jgi:hypothetical protein
MKEKDSSLRPRKLKKVLLEEVPFRMRTETLMN